MSHHMTMGRQLVGRALTTRRAPRSSSHARGPLSTIVRPWVRQQQAQTEMCKAHRALHTNTSRHRRASDPCCCSRAFAPDPPLPLAVSTQLPRPRRQRQAATTVELQQLVAHCPDTPAPAVVPASLPTRSAGRTYASSSTAESMAFSAAVILRPITPL